MGRWKKYLKPLAFLPAIFLFGGLIGYRTGFVQVAAEPDPQPEGQRTTATEQEEAQPQRPSAESPPPVFLPGSKSINLKGVVIGLTLPGEDPRFEPPSDHHEDSVGSILASRLPKLRLPPWLQPSYLSKLAPQQPPVFLPSTKSFRPIPFQPQRPGASVSLDPLTLPDNLTPVKPSPPAPMPNAPVFPPPAP